MKSIVTRPKVSRELLVCLVLAAAVFASMLGRRDVVTSHEARVAQSARHMADSGWPWEARPVRVPLVQPMRIGDDVRLVPSPRLGHLDVNPWIVPILHSRLRIEKPPLPAWITAVAFKLFGVSETTVRLAPALLGVLSMVLVFEIARRVLGRRAAAPAAVVWITTEFVVDEFRRNTSDPYLAFFVLLAVWGSIRAMGGGGGRYAVIAYVALALGVLTKGPVVLAHVTPAIVLIRVLSLSRQRRIRWRAHLVGGALFVIIALPWFVWIGRHVPHAGELWRYESIGEFGANVEKARPWWLYLAVSFQTPLPWLPMWIAGWVMALGRRPRRRFFTPRRRRRLFAVAWYAMVLAFFSFAHVKKMAYLLPVLAAQALIAADAIATLLALARRRITREITGALLTMQTVIGAGYAIGLIVMMIRARSFGFNTIDFTIASIGLIVALLAAVPVIRSRWSGWLPSQALAYAVLLIVTLGVFESARENRRSSRAFAAAVVEHMKSEDVPLLTYRLPEDVAFYLPIDLRDGYDASRVLIVIDHGRRDPPVSAEVLSEQLDDAPVTGFRRVVLPVDDGGGRWQLFDVLVQRNRT